MHGLDWRRVTVVLSGLGLTASFATLVAADVMPWWWWTEIFQHPRPQIAVGSLVCAGICAGLLQWRWRWIGLLVPLWAAVGLLPSLAGSQDRGDAVRCSLVSANVYSANPDPAAAVATLLGMHADVLILLEADFGWKPILQPLREAYPIHREILRDDNFGVCAYVRTGSIDVWQPEGIAVPGLIVRTGGLEILGVHPPPPFSATYHAWWRAELTAISAWTVGRPYAVVVGDLNATPWCSAYRRLCRDGSLTGPGGLMAWSPTWLRGTPLASTIDHILVGRSVSLRDFSVGPDIASDHRPISASLGPTSSSSSASTPTSWSSSVPGSVR